MPSSYQFALWKQESFLVPPAFFRNLIGSACSDPQSSTQLAHSYSQIIRFHVAPKGWPTDRPLGGESFMCSQ
jgi:hypothetical protein